MGFATLHFDTYKVVNLLREKGYTKEEAEGFIEAIQEVTLSGVATKQDIHDLDTKIERSLSDTIKFQLVQTTTIIVVMVGLFSLIFMKLP